MSTPESPAPEVTTPEAPLESPPAPIDPKLLDRHECEACGYIYEPAKGDDRRQVAAGTPFEEVPASWRCPVCGATKPRFRNIGVLGAPSGFKENLKYGFGVNTLTPGQKNILIFGGLALAFLFFLSLYGLQ
jgi:rubredoxin